MRAFTVREQYGRDGGAREWGRGARPHEWDGAEFGDAEHDGRREGGDYRNYINDNKDYDGRRADGNDRNYINDNKDYDGSTNGYPHHDYGYDEPNRRDDQRDDRRDDQRDDRRGSDMGARPQRAAWGASGRPAPSGPPPPSQDGSATSRAIVVGTAPRGRHGAAALRSGSRGGPHVHQADGSRANPSAHGPGSDPVPGCVRSWPRPIRQCEAAAAGPERARTGTSGGVLMGYAGPHDPTGRCTSRVPLGKSRKGSACTGCVCVWKLGKDTDGVQLRERERCAGSE